MKTSNLIKISVVAAALSAVASAHAGFVYTSAYREIALNSPAGPAGASSSLFGTFSEFRSHSAPFLSGFVQQNSNLSAAEIRLTAFTQVSSSSAAFPGPISGSSLSTTLFGVDRLSSVTLSVTTTRQASGALGLGTVSVLLRDMTAGGTVVFSSNSPISTTQTLTLEAGREYQVDVTNLASVASGTGSASANYSVVMTAVAVPAPGALPLAGLVLLGRRRRR